MTTEWDVKPGCGPRSVSNDPRNPQPEAVVFSAVMCRWVSSQACPKPKRRQPVAASPCLLMTRKLPENTSVFNGQCIHSSRGTLVATAAIRRKDFDMAARTDAVDFKDCRAVDSTKGSSAGGAAGGGLMAVTGRAPVLPADYSFLWSGSAGGSQSPTSSYTSRGSEWDVSTFSPNANGVGADAVEALIPLTPLA